MKKMCYAFAIAAFKKQNRGIQREVSSKSKRFQDFWNSMLWQADSVGGSVLMPGAMEESELKEAFILCFETEDARERFAEDFVKRCQDCGYSMTVSRLECEYDSGEKIFFSCLHPNQKAFAL